MLSAGVLPADESGSPRAILDLTDDPVAEWRLPARLREISALAMSADYRLFAVDDERAVIYQIDYVDGRLAKAFTLGNPAERGDFEGLAIVGDTFYLMSSDAELYAAREGADGERVPYRRIETGLGKQCEFEGLAFDAAKDRLLLLCKDVRREADIDTVSVFSWDPKRQALDRERRIELPVGDISSRLNTRRLHPSGIAVRRKDGAILIVAARERALIALDADGGFADAILLPGAQRHPQAEGIELSEDGRIIIADEGGRGRARLTVYEGRQGPQ